MAPILGMYFNCNVMKKITFNNSDASWGQFFLKDIVFFDALILESLFAFRGKYFLIEV
jgi:hypothetical protein